MVRLHLLLIFLLGAIATTTVAQNTASSQTKPPFSLDELQRRNFLFFWELADNTNYQIPDRYPSLTFSSIAATGFGLTTYLVGAERGWITRAQAAERVFKTLEILKNLPQGPERTGVAGYKGFFYHFLNLNNALRFQQVELSTIDTGLLMAGILSCLTYFDGDNATERGIRDMADFLYRRVEWDWFLNDQDRLSMGWHPERGFISADWRGYNEAMVLLLMAIGSPTHPAPAEMWQQWCKTYYWSKYQGQEMVNFGPLFGHQYSHIWVDFRGIRDPYMREKGLDYFENSRRATLANRAYCISNPFKFKGYGNNIWGLTACDGPADRVKSYEGREVQFRTYSARGVARDYHNDDGTIAPTAVGGSLPFAPEVCLPALEAMWNRWPVGPYGFYDAYNETYTWDDAQHPSLSPPLKGSGEAGVGYWVDKDYLGIDQGPIVLMIENYRSDFIWKLMKKNPYIVAGLQRAGFTGGWLETVASPQSPVHSQQSAASSQAPKPDDRRLKTEDRRLPMEPESFFRRADYVDAGGNVLPYQLLEPWRAKKGEKYPLVVFLHGSGERGSDNVGQMKNGVFSFVEQSTREKHPCFLLVPQCPQDSGWAGTRRTPDGFTFDPEHPSVPGRQVLELVEKLLRENPSIDRQRVYLTGLSMGGFGTFDLLMRRPDLFAAGMPLCGGGDPAHAQRIKDIPLWIFHGQLDPVVPVRFSREMVDALRPAGASPKYTEYTTLDHFIWNETYYNPAALDWLFAQKKKN